MPTEAMQAQNADVWEKIKKIEAKPQPTPPIGLGIVWFGGGDRRRPGVPARVFAHEGEPGRIAVVYDTPRGPQYKGGVYHHSTPLNIGGNSTIAMNGTWDYIDGEKVPQWHYDQFKAYIDKRKQAQRNSEEMQLKTEQAQKAKQAELAGA